MAHLKTVSDIWGLTMSMRYGGSNVSKILRFTLSCSVSLKLITRFHSFLQVCCGNTERPSLLEEIRMTYPECHPDFMHGKT